MTDYSRTLMRQYDHSAALQALLASFHDWVDLDRFTAAFLRDVWDISTARGFGLDIWGRILGQSRYLQVAAEPDDNFGFDASPDPGDTNWKPFNVAPFYTTGPSGATSFALDDDSFRQLLLIKAAANIASCDAPSLNALLRALFGHRGPAFVEYDLNQPMVLTYVLDFFPTNVERTIIESGLVPVPAGMEARIVFKAFDYAPFGFDGANAGVNPAYVSGFNQGPFYSQSS